ncbi:MAG: hypothetical protein COV43_03910 [Deltaproteobacteria bacterium CG11_big_fil_rev_8_21_14_0_20_42_23]|nr:MAG: hypothetical protein COV43_03910 [Deltaproteobacteria bacterium CG11_big_fil_rev_8_21_14_0_20_42_23]PJC63381.1 MAG: hypothetical protein CO021_09880 [Deltaproteobacteria bacterium CG_4_9_14_0_2_um_filter_42_21]
MYAAIDIGTNTAILLIGEVKKDGSIRTVLDTARIPRLGQGLTTSKYLHPDAKERTLATFQEFKLLCDQHNVERIAAVGTAALRKADDGKDFAQSVHESLGIDLQIISGEEEAFLTYIASAHDFGNDIFVLDIGGGSTELISLKQASDKSLQPNAKNTEELNIASIPFGTVLLMEEHFHSDPVSDEEYKKLCTHIHALLEEYFPHSLYGVVREKTFVATAGTATTLAAINLGLKHYDAEKVHGSKLSYDTVLQLTKKLRSLSFSERKKIIGLHPKRADVIVVGSTLLLKVMEHLQCKQLTVSDKGVRYGLFAQQFLPL